MLDKCLTTKEVAEILGLDPKTLINRRSLGTETIPFFKTGSAVRYLQSDVLAHIEANKRTHNA